VPKGPHRAVGPGGLKGDPMSTDIRQHITDLFVEGIKRGSPPWRRPWSATGGGLPRSVATGRRYSGANVLALEAARLARGYSSP